MEVPNIELHAINKIIASLNLPCFSESINYLKMKRTSNQYSNKIALPKQSNYIYEELSVKQISPCLLSLSLSLSLSLIFTHTHTTQSASPGYDQSLVLLYASGTRG